MNIYWAQVAILSALSIIVGIGTVIGVQYESLFGKFVYAQSNTTGLPPVELESVESDNAVTSNENSTDYLQYEDSDIGFKIDYPSDWEVQDADLTNNAVVAFSPPDNAIEVDVKLFPRINSQSLKTFGNEHIKDAMQISTYYRNGTTLLCDQPAIRATGTFISSPGIFGSLTGEEPTTKKVLIMSTLLKEKKSFLDLIYYADKSNFMDYLPEVEHMIKSLQFTNTKPTIQED